MRPVSPPTISRQAYLLPSEGQHSMRLTGTRSNLCAACLQLSLTVCAASASCRKAQTLCRPQSLARRNSCTCSGHWLGPHPHTAPAGQQASRSGYQVGYRLQAHSSDLVSVTTGSIPVQYWLAKVASWPRNCAAPSLELMCAALPAILRHCSSNDGAVAYRPDQDQDQWVADPAAVLSPQS
jgi:hypothetical protein